MSVLIARGKGKHTIEDIVQSLESGQLRQGGPFDGRLAPWIFDIANLSTNEGTYVLKDRHRFVVLVVGQGGLHSALVCDDRKPPTEKVLWHFFDKYAMNTYVQRSLAQRSGVYPPQPDLPPP